MLVQLGKPRLAPSQVLDKNSPGFTQDTARTSQSAILERHSVEWLIQRATNLLGVQPQHAETPQVTRYLPGEQYQPHYDTLDEEQESGKAEVARAGQRVATLCCYLTDLPAGAGGATIFPALQASGIQTLRVRPRQGCALLFFPANPSGKVDKRTLHGGTAVETGEKWISQVWVRQRAWL